MRKKLLAAFLGMSVFCVGPAVAGDLVFPETEEAIVEALSLKDGSTVFQGTEYLSEKGRVYKIVKGKRYRVRGLAAIVDAEIVPKAGAMIRFDSNSATIRPESHALLDEFGKALNSGLLRAVLMVAGHTDSKGSNEYNLALSERRSRAVKAYLGAHHGISAERLVVRAYGESRPIDSNDTDEGRAMNRRVEFIRVE